MASPDFSAAFAHLFPAGWPAPITWTASKLLGLDELSGAFHEWQTLNPAVPLADRLLQYLRVSCRVTDADLSRVPISGPALVVANHPSGILEGAVLATVLKQRRADVRFLASDLLGSLPELSELVIPIDSLDATSVQNSQAMHRAAEFLKGGGLLVVFPARAVSHYDWRRGSIDPEWSPALARLVMTLYRAGIPLPLIPIHVSGFNSPAFHAAGLVHERLRTALLVRELLNKKASTVELRIGKPVEAERLAELPDPTSQIEYLRWRTYLLAERNGFRHQTGKPLRRAFAKKQLPIRAAVEPDLLAHDVARLKPLVEGGGLQAFVGGAAQLPHVLTEIGRLRELTFRAAGEGTGRATDLDRFDQTYLHLFLWNADKREIAGAYRIGHAAGNPAALYTATLFEYGSEFLERLGPALELGRSFVRAEYQRSFSPLLLLWKAIGQYVAHNPQYTTLFGPVSISNSYQAASRELMIAFLEKRELLHDWAALVRPRNAPPRTATRVGTATSVTEGCRDLDELSDVVADIETGASNVSGVPVLLRHYLKLGGKLLGFNVDREFAGALDGLVVVDLTRTEPRLLARYLGKAEADAFLAYQKGIHGEPQPKIIPTAGAA